MIFEWSSHFAICFILPSILSASVFVLITFFCQALENKMILWIHARLTSLFREYMPHALMCIIDNFLQVLPLILLCFYSRNVWILQAGLKNMQQTVGSLRCKCFI